MIHKRITPLLFLVHIIQKHQPVIRIIPLEQEVKSMGFYVMILSLIIGIVFLALGFSRKQLRQSKLLNGITKAAGFGFVLFAVWLGFPK